MLAETDCFGKSLQRQVQWWQSSALASSQKPHPRLLRYSMQPSEIEGVVSLIGYVLAEAGSVGR